MARARSRRLATCSVIAGCALVAGCWSLTASFDDLSGGDAGLVSEGSMLADASSLVDAVGSDGTRPADGGAFSCQALAPPAPTFCEDFSGPDLARWSDLARTKPDASAVTVDPASGALVTRLEPNGGDGCGYALAVKEIAGAYRKARIRYAVRLDTNVGCNGASSVISLVKDGLNECHSILYITKSTISPYDQNVNDGARDEQGHTGSAYTVPADGWFRIDQEIDWQNGTVKVSLDGRVLISEAAKTCPHVTTRGDIKLGVHCQVDVASACDLRYDDVIVDFFP